VRIEAVITCVNHADFLAHTLPENLQHLDHVVVVTSPTDKATKDICNYYGVVCVDTDVFTEHGDKFNKGRGINVALNHCRHDEWLLQMDADVILPHRFRWTLGAAKPSAENLYGADRLNVNGWEKWKKVKDSLVPQFQNGCHVWAHPELDFGARLLHGDYGYTPIGYFQLWHRSQKRFYPGSGASSEHSDVMFAIQWPRANRILLPQMFVYHLDSLEKPEQGVNWHGRKTPAFCPCHDYFMPENLKYGRHRHHRRHHGHHHHGHHHYKPYKPTED